MTNGHGPRDPEVRTYRGKTLEEILPRIRAELGPDAVILRQRDGLMGGIGGFFQQQFVEVEARPGARRFDAYDDGPALPPAPGPAVGAANGSANGSGAAAPARAGPPAAGPSDPAPAARPADAGASGRLTAAELLARASAGGGGDARTPAEILREHRDTFARQLADAEARAAAAEAPAARPRPPAAAPARDEAAPVAPAPRRAPAAGAEAAARVDGAEAAARADRAPRRGAAAAADAPAGRTARRRAAARRRSAKARRAAAARRDAPDAGAAAPRRAPAAGAEAARADGAARPAADGARRADEPAGVGPQTTQALELAALLARTVAAQGAAAAPAAPAETAPAAAADRPADGAERAPARPVPAPLRRPAARRGLFGRRRATAIPLARVAASPAALRVAGALEQRGVAPEVAQEVIVDAAAHVLPFAADGDLRAAARVALARRIPTPEPPRLGGRAVAFVGTGGTGKTRCVAGLAAAYAGASTVPVAVVALAPADGGDELRALLKPHGVKVEAFADARAAADRIAEARQRSLVVIDTPAVPVGDARAITALAAQLGPLALDEVQLTLPATLSAAVAREQLEQLAPLAPTGIAMTHADATDHIGAVVELACATRLPLAYVNAGLALPGALAPADPGQIAERLLA